jgi:hypothetical protein
MAQWFPSQFGGSSYKGNQPVKKAASATASQGQSGTEQQPPQHDDSAESLSALIDFRKKKVKAMEEPKEKKVHPLKAPTAVYVFGVNNPPQYDSHSSQSHSNIKEERT